MAKRVWTCGVAGLLVVACTLVHCRSLNLVQAATGETPMSPLAKVALMAPPPSPTPSFAFSSGFGNWMVLQQAPAKAAVYGPIDANATGVEVTVTNTQDGSSYSVKAELNTTHQPVGYIDAGSNNPFPVTASWKALLNPTKAGGDYEITAVCTGCAGNGTVTLTNFTFGDMWYCSGQSNVRLYRLQRLDE